MSDNLSDKNINNTKGTGVVQDNSEPAIDYQKQAEEYLAGWQRARADYQNLKKENEQKLASFALQANKELLTELLPLVDYFKHAFHHLPAELKTSEWVDGMRHIQSKLEQVLAYFGIKEMEVIGEKFNPNLHEAVGEVDNSQYDTGMVVEEIRTGFMWQDQVLQAARVKIAK